MYILYTKNDKNRKRVNKNVTGADFQMRGGGGANIIHYGLCPRPTWRDWEAQGIDAICFWALFWKILIQNETQNKNKKHSCASFCTPSWIRHWQNKITKLFNDNIAYLHWINFHLLRGLLQLTQLCKLPRSPACPQAPYYCVYNGRRCCIKWLKFNHALKKYYCSSKIKIKYFAGFFLY